MIIIQKKCELVVVNAQKGLGYGEEVVPVAVVLVLLTKLGCCCKKPIPAEELPPPPPPPVT